MRNILILGSGKSSTALIDYLIENSAQEQWHVTVADIAVEDALKKTRCRKNSTAVSLALTDEAGTKQLIAASDIVVSMLPASFHIAIAGYCLQLGKHLVTPSYISERMQRLDSEVASKGLVFLNEMGLDPGIDHMSAMQLLDHLRKQGSIITGFRSHCGGLVAPESDTNPWHYKFSWNPRNVILAGQGDDGIQYKDHGKLVKLNYQQLFASVTALIVPGYGAFESYPNRDSLKYMGAYNLNDTDTMYRGTLRVPPFCKGWNLLVQWGITDDKIEITDLKGLSYKDFFERIIGNKLSTLDAEEFTLFDSVLNDNSTIPFSKATSAKVLQSLLEKKWEMKEGDKDMIVMVHEISYKKDGLMQGLQSSLVYKGKDSVNTAMAVTVGLPVAIAVKMILNKQFVRRGVLLPVYPDIYNPVLAELKGCGISFTESKI